METGLTGKNGLTDQQQVVSFTLGNELYGLEISQVREINKLSEITRVPNMPGYVEGIVNLRGKIVPIIELRTRLGMQKKEYDKDTRIVVVENGSRASGFIVDTVSKVILINQSSFDDSYVEGLGDRNKYIRSIAKLDDDILILLDLNSLLVSDITMNRAS